MEWAAKSNMTSTLIRRGKFEHRDKGHMGEGCVQMETDSGNGGCKSKKAKNYQQPPEAKRDFSENVALISDF